MKKSLLKDTRGLAPLAVVLIIVVVGVAGFAAWRVVNKDKASDSSSSQIAEQAAAECEKEIDDSDLCKFLSNWEQSASYRLISTDTSGGQTTESTFEVDGDKTRVAVSGAQSYETITIGNTTYTKAGDVWYKQTAKPEENATTAEDYKVDFEEPSEGEDTKNQTTYKNLGKEACGDLQCFKYQVIDPTNTDTTEYIWFDDADYKLRKTLSESKDGTKSEAIFEYDNVSISEPSPVKELAPNQYIVPGQSEPVTIPAL